MTAFLQPTPLTEMVRVVLSVAFSRGGVQLKSLTCQCAFQTAVVEQWLLFDQTFQISILWHPTIPIDRMTDIVAAAPALQTDDLNPQTTPDTRPHKSAMAGKEHLSADLCFSMFMQQGKQYQIQICISNIQKHSYAAFSHQLRKQRPHIS